MTTEFKHELISQVQQGAPALSLGVVGTAIMSIQWNQVFAAASTVLVLLQAGYLVWKWRKEAKDAKKD